MKRAWILISALSTLCGFLAPRSSDAFETLSAALMSKRARPTRCHAVRTLQHAGNDIQGLPNPGNDRRRKKRNKYAKFSKADKLTKDPLESLIEESEAKVRELRMNKNNKQNHPVALTDEARNEKQSRNQTLFPDTREIDPYDPSTYGYVELGTITGAHGVNGMLKLVAVTEFQERLCEAGVRHLKAPNRRSPRQVLLLEGRHRLGSEYLIRLEGVEGRDAATKLRGSILYARQEERPRDIAQDEYLVQDLVGLDVFLETGCGREGDLGGRFVGTVGGVVLSEDICAVPQLGQDMLEIVLSRGPNGVASWKDELVLIPLVPSIVPRVDLEGKAIHITPPDGLLDLTYAREDKIRLKGFLPPARQDGEKDL